MRYRIFAFEATVRTSFLDDSHAYWNGTSLFFFVEGELGRPCQVTVALPDRRWRVATARCLPYGQSLTSWPLRGLLDELLGALKGHPERPPNVAQR